MIHAGGYSKRLPSHSCSGKIFSPVPVSPTKGGCYQMLDLQLAMYLPFLKMMEPGVFIVCADDIEVMVLLLDIVHFWSLVYHNYRMKVNLKDFAKKPLFEH